MALMAPKKNTVGTAIAWIASQRKVKIGYATGVRAGCALGFSAARATLLEFEYARDVATAYPKPSPANRHEVQGMLVLAESAVSSRGCKVSLVAVAICDPCTAWACALGCTKAAEGTHKIANEKMKNLAIAPARLFCRLLN